MGRIVVLFLFVLCGLAGCASTKPYDEQFCKFQTRDQNGYIRCHVQEIGKELHPRRIFYHKFP